MSVFLLATTALLTAAAGAERLQPSLRSWAEREMATPRVVLVTLRGEDEPAVVLSRADGIEILCVGQGRALVRATPAGASFLAGIPEVAYVGQPIRPLPLVQTDALEEMRVPQAWARGEDGTGVRVGVIDVGFEGYQSRLGRELPPVVHTRSFYDGADGDGDLSGGGTVHGTACAEVVHDVAPGAELYLANVSSDLDLERAAQWMIDEGVEVISHSLAWFVGGGDGGGPIDAIVERTAREGILFVTAAGNFAQSHWTGTAQDADGDELIEVDQTGDESIGLPVVTAGHTVSLVLTWNRWPTSSDLSFAIEVHQGTSRVASSEETYAGSPYAFRVVEYAPRETTGALQVVLRHLEGDAAGALLRVIRIDGGVLSTLADHQIGAGSLAIPADSPHALSAGAYRWQERAADETLEPWSSYGPSLAGLPKPEILGPDHIQNSVYGNRSFAGTSAACPHVAGAAAVLLSAAIRGGLYDLHLGIDGVRDLLANEARGLADKDAPAGSTGWGCVRLVLDRPAAHPLEVAPEGRGLRFLSRESATEGDLRILDVRGRLLTLLHASETTPDGIVYHLSSTSPFRGARGRYWAVEGTTGRTASFFWPAWR